MELASEYQDCSGLACRADLGPHTGGYNDRLLVAGPGWQKHMVARGFKPHVTAGLARPLSNLSRRTRNPHDKVSTDQPDKPFTTVISL